jgi:hypothetical protein
MPRGALSEFMEDVATDLDKDTSDEDRRVDDYTPSQRNFSCFCWEWKKTCFQAP